MSLLAELRRRNVIRMAGLYLVGAWLIVQVAETVLPAFDVPGWVLRAVIIVLALGFAPALVFAWIFELTPEGLKRDGKVAPEDSIAPVTGRRMDRMIVVGLVAVIAVMAIERFWHAPATPAVAGVTAVTPPAASTPAAPAVSDKSIAVLPFENLSSDPDNAYFATGIQDEILTRLSKIHDLRVISRTSTMNIASKPANLPEIAAILGVSAILEGSVQRSGDAVHINVQLIRAATDEHLWAESYNRKLDDVFAVQGEVAQSVAEALDAALTGAERAVVSAQPTNNTKAYEFYLRGLALEARYTNATPDLEARAAAYRRAVEHDPKFALAWAGLARVQTEIWFNERTPAQRALVEAALDKARELAPDTSETSSAVGIYLYYVERDYDGAFAAYSRALELRPNDGLAVYTLGNVRRRQGRWDEALKYHARGTEMDPLATNTWFNYGMTLRALRRYDEAQAAFDRGLAAIPGDPELLTQKFGTFFAAGDLAGAEAFASTLTASEKSIPIIHNDLAQLRVLRRDFPAAIAALRTQLGKRSTMTREELEDTLLTLGSTEYLAGDRAAAAEHLTEARDMLQGYRARGNINPYLTGALARVTATLGDHDAAIRLADEAVEGLANDALGLPGAIEAQAYVHMAAGDRAEAVALLRKAQAMPMVHGPTPGHLRLNPHWDPLREEPGFAELLVDRPVIVP